MVSVKTKSDTVAEIGRLLSAVSDKFDGDVDEEREYMAARCPARLRDAVFDIPAPAIHLLAAIADGGAVNLVGLAAASGQLKGTVSKHVQRLVEAGLVARDPVPGNRKEIRLTLTADGREVEEVHRRMHDEMAGGLADFLSRYSVAELETVTKILGDLLRTTKRGVRLVSDPDR